MSNKNNQAFTYGLGGLAVLAALMVGYYYFSHRYQAATDNQAEMGEVTEAPPAEKSEFVGVYAATDGPMESKAGRIAFFLVNRRDEGGYLGSVKVDAIGAEGSAFLECVDVRIEEREFFLKCSDATHGTISVSGEWQNVGGLTVKGKVLWVKDGESLLEVQRSFSHSVAE